MSASDHWVVVGLDNGGTSNNATVLDSHGHFLVDRLVENASFVQDGPEVALDALASALDHVLELTGTAAFRVTPSKPHQVRAAPASHVARDVRTQVQL